MKKNKGGRPKEIQGETTRVTYYLTVEQAEFIVEKAVENSVSESEIVRSYIDYLRSHTEILRKGS